MTEKISERKDSRKLDKSTYMKHLGCTKDPVILDNIWKEMILRDKIHQHNWSTRYDFFTGDFFQKLLAKECKKAGLPADTFKHKVTEDAIKRSPISLKPSPPIPKTTSAMVGFRSSRPEHNLEFTGKAYISPKWTLEPPQRPNEYHVTHQKFIFLG